MSYDSKDGTSTILGHPPKLNIQGVHLIKLFNYALYVYLCTPNNIYVPFCCNIQVNVGKQCKYYTVNDTNIIVKVYLTERPWIIVSISE